jgi:Mn-dependent DtxR family transcriptional regulator
MGTQWIQIPRRFLEIDKGTKFVDILVYAAIDYQKDSATHKSRIGQRTIADKYNIALSKVEESVKRLKEAGFISYEQLPSEKYKDSVFNEYTLPQIKNDFLMLKPEVLKLPLKPKERGLLIYLQLIALPDMNDIGETKVEDIAKRIGICRQTASKYLKQFIKSGYLHQSRYGIYKCQYLAKKIAEQTKQKHIILC